MDRKISFEEWEQKAPGDKLDDLVGLIQAQKKVLAQAKAALSGIKDAGKREGMAYAQGYAKYALQKIESLEQDSQRMEMEARYKNHDQKRSLV
jgi:hypothetical protein